MAGVGATPRRRNPRCGSIVGFKFIKNSHRQMKYCQLIVAPVESREMLTVIYLSLA